MVGDSPGGAAEPEEGEEVSRSDQRSQGTNLRQSAKRSRPVHSESDSDSGSDHPQAPRKRGACPGPRCSRARTRQLLTAHFLAGPFGIVGSKTGPRHYTQAGNDLYAAFWAGEPRTKQHAALEGEEGRFF